jgi:hypothetical protein
MPVCWQVTSAVLASVWGLDPPPLVPCGVHLPPWLAVAAHANSCQRRRRSRAIGAWFWGWGGGFVGGWAGGFLLSEHPGLLVVYTAVG